MDIMAYADDAARLDLARQKMGLDSERLAMEQQQEADTHVLRQQQVQMNKLKMGEELLSLMRQKTETDAFKLYDPENPDSLNAVAGYMGQHGDAKGAMGVIAESNKAKAFQSEILLRDMNIRKARTAQVAQVANSMLDSPDSYMAGRERLISQGINPDDYGLSADPDKGMVQAKRIAMSQVTMGQRLRLDMEQQRFDRQTANDAIRLAEQKRRDDRMERQYSLTERRLQDNEKKQDMLADYYHSLQTGREENRQRDMQAYAMRQKKDIQAYALDAINADEKLGGNLNDDQKQMLARRIADETLATNMKKAKSVRDFLFQDWHDQIDTAISETSKDPAYNKKHWWSGKGNIEGKITTPKVGQPDTSTAPHTPKSGYSVGQTLKLADGTYRVTGFDPKDGEPLVEKVGK